MESGKYIQEMSSWQIEVIHLTVEMLFKLND